jgi:uncharacterized repeat protein (TIGR01451 family)
MPNSPRSSVSLAHPRAGLALAVLLTLLGSIAFGPAAGAGGVAHRPVPAPAEVELPVGALAAAAAVATAPIAGVAGLEHAAPTDDGRIQVLVELVDPPAAATFAAAMRGNSPADRRALVAAGAASQAQFRRVQAAQEPVAAALAASPIGAREIYRVARALNGIAVAVDAAAVPAVARIPGVKRILPILLEHTTSITSVPFIGAPNVWADTIGLPSGADGTGVRIGIIDTGIDYLHGDFGGTGQLATYQAESTTTTGFTTAGSFPTAKVVGGIDFAGDAYTGGNTPVPDVNPMDCNGHGSHVSGTAAGFGVTAAGATFAGPYDANPATYSGLRIVPGVAPKALLYGIRVFGCAGSTGLTVQGIDWAMDPNGDGDLSDHLDVINMSLGSDFGTEINASSVASDNAAEAGVIVAISAGNSSDVYFIAGAPGVASRAITAAASLDAGETTPVLQINAPPAAAGDYFAGAAIFGGALTPSGTPPGAQNVVIALDAANAAGPSTTDGCTALTNAAAVAGNIALIDRGTCAFTVKAKNAQNAGAVAVIIANNAPGSPPPGLGGTDPTVTIPVISVTLADANKLKANIAGMNATLLGPSGGDTLASFSSRGPRQIFGSPLRVKPDISAPGLNITSVQTGHTCLTATGCTGLSDPSGFQAGNQALVISGTSMASPHVAGTMALLRQLHPDWSVEELKALAMNYALHDLTVFPNATPPRFGISRAGAGRVDPALAAQGSVVAFNADDPGLVSVTFEPEVAGNTTQTKTVRLINRGLTPQTFDLGFDTVVNSPGVTFSLPGGASVTVPAADSVEIPVQMSATGSLMGHTLDPSVFPTQGVQANFGDEPRNYLTEHQAYLTLSQSSTLKLRLPIYMAEKPASVMSAPAVIPTGGAPTGSTTIPLSGTGLCTGTLSAGPTCTGVGTLPAIESLVSPFELQVISPLNPTAAPPYADIHYAGVSYLQAGGSRSTTNDLVLFGVASWGDWSTLNDVAYDICVDNNGDGVYEKIVYNSNPSIFVSGAIANDNFVRIIDDTATNGNTILGLGSFANLLSPASFDTELHLNNVMVLGATPSQLGIASTATTTIKYKIVTCPATNPTCARTATGDRCSPAAGTFFDQAAGPFTYNWAAQGLNFGGNVFAEDLAGSSLPVTWNTANMTANGSLGALLLHHFNQSANRAEVVLLQGAASADLGLAHTVDNPTPAAGGTVVLTVTVTNHGPNDATGVVVSDALANGLTYVSDDGGGAYVPGSGLWTVGALANGASATLHITATVESTGEIDDTAEIGAASPLDPNASNNMATATLSAPRTSDLHLTFTANVASIHPGGTITYTLAVKNNGGDPAYSVNVQEAFPAIPMLHATSFTASQGLYTPATGIWNLASLPIGDTATLTFLVTAPNIAGNLVNNASTMSNQAAPHGGEVDPNLADNSATVTVAVVSPAAVSGTKAVSGNFVAGGTITYTVVLTNNGTFTQQDNPGDEFTDTLPAQLSSITATAGSGAATVTGSTVHWNGSIAAGGSVTITITAIIDQGTAGQTISNQGTVFFDADGNGTNESSAPTDDPATAAANDPTSFQVSAIAAVPALTPAGLGMLALLLAAGAMLALRRRRA